MTVFRTIYIPVGRIEVSFIMYKKELKRRSKVIAAGSLFIAFSIDAIMLSCATLNE